MKLRIAGLALAACICWGGADASAEVETACPATIVLSSSDIAERWRRAREEEGRAGLLRFVENAADWRRTPSFVMEQIDRVGGRPGFVRVVRQSDAWRRIDEDWGHEQRTEYFNLETGVRAVIRRSQSMSNTRFEVTRPRVSERWRLFRTAETNVRQTLIGERCTIVRLDPVEVHPDREYPRQPTEACLTRDGIELWRRTDSPPGANNGSPMEMLEASSLSRQSIPEADVRPPPHMLNLQYWMDAAAKLQRPSTGARMSPATPDHIVCFEESSPPSAARLEERYNGAWSYQDRGAPNGQGLVSIVGRGLQFLLVTDDGGEPWNIMLSIWQVSDDHQIEWPLSERSSTILGERCFWPNPEDEILIPGASHPTACRTRDGVVLQRNWSGTRNSPASSLTATRVQRGALPADAFMPPPGAFDWIDP